MTGYLKDNLGIKCPVTFTNNYYGLASIYSQSRADYMDTHFYWNHPSFTSGWSDIDFTMNNQSMVLDPEGSTIARMPLCRVKDMPLVLSEYNHPYPYIFQAEAPSLLYAYGSFFDLDGILWHAYYDYHNRYTQRYQDMFFDIAMNPVMMTQLLLAVPYRLGYIKPAAEPVVANYREQDIFDNTKTYQDNDELNMPDGYAGSSFLETGFAHSSFQSDSTCIEGSLTNPGKLVVSSTGELTWDGVQGVFTVNNPYWQGATGYLKGKTIELEDITLSEVETTNDLGFAAVHLISLDSLPISESGKLVLLTSARLENEGFRWNDTKTSPVALGGTRALCEPVSGMLILKYNQGDPFYVYRLDERGIRSVEVEKDQDLNGNQFRFNKKTLWYAIVKDSTTAGPPSMDPGIASSDCNISCHPNPCRDFTVATIEMPVNQKAEIVLLSAQGQILQNKPLSILKGHLVRAELDVSSYAPGMYFFGLRTEDGKMIMKRLVVIE